MRFGRVATKQAEGAILAHSHKTDAGTFRKGHRLDAADCTALIAAGLEEVTVARLETGDVHEDEAAARLARALIAQDAHVSLVDAFTGRVNLHSEADGLLVVDAAKIDVANAIDEAITIATLPAHARVTTGRMVATVKMIPFAVPGEALERVCEVVSGALRVAAFSPIRVGVVATRLPSLKPSVMDKTARILAERLAVYDGSVVCELRVDHDAGAIADAIAELDIQAPDVTLVFGASAITDRRDDIPAAIEMAGGSVQHFGMPVDPGNLLLLGARNGKPVLGAPGCARSSKENGFDWVLDRVAAGLDVTANDIVAMGVGGLLMEIPSRPQPRAGRIETSRERAVGALVLAAGRSTRMGGPNKLLEHVGGRPLVRRAVEAALASKAEPVVVVTGNAADDVAAALDGLDVTLAHNPDFAMGLSTSLARGLAALPETVAGAVVCLADMPGIDADLLDTLIGGFVEAPEGTILVPTVDGKRGNPVVWSRRYFAALAAVSGDVGGRALIGENAAAVVELPVGSEALADVDTPDALAAVRKTHGD